MNGPSAGSAFHGGMNRFAVTVAICAACRFASAYVSRLNGAEPPG